jgi:hypothetical protein
VLVELHTFLSHCLAVLKWLDVAPETHKLRRDAIHLCVDLASRTRQLPSSYYVKGVNIDVSQTRAGGFGVVYRGLFDGKAVAVKQPQVHIDIDTSLTVRCPGIYQSVDSCLSRNSTERWLFGGK